MRRTSNFGMYLLSLVDCALSIDIVHRAVYMEVSFLKVGHFHFGRHTTAVAANTFQNYYDDDKQSS